MRMLPFMAFTALCSCTPAPKAQVASPEQADFSKAYRVSVSYEDGECLFAPGHLGYTASQFERAMNYPEYERANGIELLTWSKVPRKCIEGGTVIAKELGFQKVRARKGTEKDIRKDDFLERIAS